MKTKKKFFLALAAVITVGIVSYYSHKTVKELLNFDYLNDDVLGI